MAQFITTTFSGVPDVALQLGNEEWVRKLAIGSTWNHIRIGVLYQLSGTANTSNGTGFSIGMCSGTAAPFGNASTTNFIGIEVIVGLTYNANGSNPFYPFASTNMFACKKVGATITASSNVADSVGMFVPTNGGNARRGLLYVDITKGSPNYTIGVTGAASGVESTDFTPANLLLGMTQTFGSISLGVGGPLTNGNGAMNIATDESAGGFDTVDFYSNELNNPINLFEVAVEKLA